MSQSVTYCASLTQYIRRKTITVHVGQLPLGVAYPIRVQSMTTTDTMDTAGSVAQTLRMVASGAEYVRLTAQGLNEARNLADIKEELRARGSDVPLIADIHFTPNAAQVAATVVEKVRINPGNYADKKKFETHQYTEASYRQALDRMREKFEPLVVLCKKHGTALRIGTNHGSLSDRMMSRFGDTPLGMVESALEFIRICEEHEFYDLVISMKASNTRVMVQAYRLLVHKLEAEGLKPYPLHLGVTEAGEGEEGRIKSAVGIGALLEDGLGDTVRVSLTEDPEHEAPVAQALIDRYAQRSPHEAIEPLAQTPIDPFGYHKRPTTEVLNFGDRHPPRVIADFGDTPLKDKRLLKAIGHYYLPEPDKWRMGDTGADYIYCGRHVPTFMLPNGLKAILAFDTWRSAGSSPHQYPLLHHTRLHALSINQAAFVTIDAAELSALDALKNRTRLVLILTTDNTHAMAALRRFVFEMMIKKIKLPVVFRLTQAFTAKTPFQLASATDLGGLLIDGLGDGVMLAGLGDKKVENETAFGILQAARTRMTKTEYISCPSCGRTLFDLQETTAKIRKRTDHLKGVKIGIMGCVVNGPGEMADADYGYVGSGKDKITLYKGQQVVKRGVPSATAVDELIEMMKQEGSWIDPSA